jgi:hypothetical protein
MNNILNKKVERDKGVILIFILITICCFISILSQNSPALRRFLMPRFGWIEMFLYANTLIFLTPWLWKPSNFQLLISSGITLFITILNGKNLYNKGTVAIIENPFTDRLHSSWFWSIFTYSCFGLYLLFVYIKNLTKKE